MKDKQNASGNLLPDAKRLTAFGRFICKISLGKIPQLVNIIRNEVSLIGCSILLFRCLHLCSVAKNCRQEVKQTITDLAMVNGRNAISWDEKLKLDVWYVDHLSFLLDLKIFWLTLKKVLVREGISSNTSVTMEKFKGN